MHLPLQSSLKAFCGSIVFNYALLSEGLIAVAIGCYSSCLKCNQCKTCCKSGAIVIVGDFLVLQGVEQIKNEVEDPGTALIDGIHGHGR